MKSQQKGVLTVITGPMFSGKTGKLIAMTEVFTRMGHVVVVLKPSIDNRYGLMREIHSHDHKSTQAIVVDGESVGEIIAKVTALKADKVIIDETQFFRPKKIRKIIETLLWRGVDVAAAGLLYDYRREPFGVMPELLGLADEHLELFAICQKCGRIARHSERVKGGEAEIEVGAADKYIAVCERCHTIYSDAR